mmetsp:Transcript_9166/g.23211  ORF Transcript_9166/g.23211 Transcript_9166/m.23211 type:complete len:560 (-) Transcript_9166:1740-3419(-)
MENAATMNPTTGGGTGGGSVVIDTDNLSVTASIVENPSGGGSSSQSVVSHGTHATHSTKGTAPDPSQQQSQQKQHALHHDPAAIIGSPTRSLPPSSSVNASPASNNSSRPTRLPFDTSGAAAPPTTATTTEDRERQNPFDNLHVTYDNFNNPQQRVQSFPAVPTSASNNTHSDDDDLTEPSTSVNTSSRKGGANHNVGSVSIEDSAATTNESVGYTRSDGNEVSGATSTFGRLIESANTRQTKGSISRPQLSRGTSNDEGDLIEGALIYGYLQKLGRNNKWQTRWFETDGECLTYYKSSKRVKLLATLDLAKVGSIVINHEDLNGCCFTINISERPYHLRADSRAACKDWVIMLNRVKEARMQEGNVKIVNDPPDLLADNFTPRVVVVANRQRTHVVEDEDLASWEAGGYGNSQVDPAMSGNGAIAAAHGSNRLARWQKPKTSLSKWANKVLRWARSLRKKGCMDAENHVVLDHHLHPPGHDDVAKAGGNKTISTNPSATDSWSKNQQHPVDPTRPPVNVTITNRNDFYDTDSMNNPSMKSGPAGEQLDDDEDEARELS